MKLSEVDEPWEQHYGRQTEGLFRDHSLYHEYARGNARTGSCDESCKGEDAPGTLKSATSYGEDGPNARERLKVDQYQRHQQTPTIPGDSPAYYCSNPSNDIFQIRRFDFVPKNVRM